MMKKEKTLTKIFCVCAMLILFAGCDRKSCNDVVCGYNQNCYNGNCFCNDGYEGSDCSVESCQKYIGNYQVSESCGSTPCTACNYTAYITPEGFDVRKIYINNIFNQGTQALAVIYTDESNQGNYLNIASQTSGGLTFSGQGYFEPANNRLRLELTYEYNFTSYQCTHTFYKQ